MMQYQSTDIAALIGSVLNQDDVWNTTSQASISSMNFPDQLLGRRKEILRGDIHREWGRWFIEQFMDERYFIENINYPKVFLEVNAILKNILSWDFEEDKVKTLARIITKYVLDQVQFVKSTRKRKVLDNKDKSFLLSLYSSQPRCWLTGLPFSDNAIDLFLGYEPGPIMLPEFVDKYLPIGLLQQHLTIEIDHLYPFHCGGDDDFANFKLICGWANRVKSSQISFYMKGTGNVGKSNIGLDNYYWALRAIGMRRKCEHPNCTATLENSPLTIESYHGEGKIINPISMKVLCYDHIQDKERFIKREKFIAS
ncbi:hypothetical protein Entas_0483 [Enterobacter soli]|uniref:HNH endonuclease domain-containing protein n=1 Tax=Enterobacter soli TaxID=885040 RepID=UPI000223C5DE|nr:HNH endonuclease domain-containing protein [Enterobacter soli]AEN63237.1 hypothetical protein Entas_0483 [Enterobacter soli]OAT40854.1 hypothetical protein M987_01656 [Enterobacter soli ATCC BAA-2102]